MSVARTFASLVLPLVLSAWTSTSAAASSPRYHTVAAGQRLSSIAKRYQVSVEAICTANGIDRHARLKVGGKLLVPSKDDKDGTMTRRQYGPPESNDAKDGATAETLLASTREPERPSTHRVYAGQRLESIAKRYQVSVEALCQANHLHKHDKLKLGQVLVIPGSLPDGGLSSIDSEAHRFDKGVKSPKKGYLDLSTYTTRYRGVVFDHRGKIEPGTVEAVSRLFAATGSRPRVDARLIALLADVSEHFDGRPIRVVSGWRDHSYFEDSRHKHSQAIDFSIPGVPNTVVRDYVRRYRNCGVGYYPNSSFVHLDVRETAAYWVDYAGPGEAPRSRPHTFLADNTGEHVRDRDDRDDDGSGPIEEAGADVDDRPTRDASKTPSTGAAGAAATEKPSASITAPTSP